MPKPLLILQSPLTGKYYATRSYKYLNESKAHIQVTGKKEDVTEQVEQYIRNATQGLTAENKRLRGCIHIAIAYAAIALEKKDFPITAHRIKEDMKLFEQALRGQKDE